MGTPALNLDVLLGIMSISDMCTISRLMQASRQLYHEGPKYLLRDGVDLAEPSSIRSFVAFMRADYPHRLRLLDLLSISTGRLPGMDAYVLGKFLVDCEPHLEIQELSIDRAEEFFESSPGLAGAFALLSHVKHLTVSEIGSRANGFLMSSRSCLVSAVLSMIPLPQDNYEFSDSDDDSDADDDEDDEEKDDDFRNPIPQLRNSQDTLETLDVRWCDSFSCAGDLYAQTYPHVDTLSLTANELPLALHYARAFPNVQHLTLKCDARELGLLGTDPEDFLTFRVKNQIELTEHQHAAGGWTSLQTVHGTLTDHFLLGLVCPVAQLHIAGPLMDKRFFRCVLATTRPPYVRFNGFDVDVFTHDSGFTRLLRGYLLEPVRAFEILLVPGSVLEPEEVAMAKALVGTRLSLLCILAAPLTHTSAQDALIAGIATLPSLRSFGITLCGFSLTPSRSDPPSPVARPRQPCPAEEYLRTLDVAALALRIRAAVPRLQVVAVTLIGHPARANACATLGEDVVWDEEEGEEAVERIPLRHAAALVRVEITTDAEGRLGSELLG